MAPNIKTRRIEMLLAEMKAASSKGRFRVVSALLRREVDQLRRQRRIATISRRYRSRLRATRMSPEDIIGYDADGLPS